MSDLLAGAAVLGAVLTGLIKLVHDFIYGDSKARVKIGACLVVSVVVVLLVGASDFSHDTVILNHPLDAFNIWSQILVATLLAGIACTLWAALGAVSNVGENRVDKQTVANTK